MDEVWADIYMDFVEGLPLSKGKITILVVVDRLTKHAHSCALTHPCTVANIAKSFVENIVMLHSVPKSIVLTVTRSPLANFRRISFVY